jgi:hypothetical protein
MLVESRTPFLAGKRVHDEDNDAKENLDRYRCRAHYGFDSRVGCRGWPPCPMGPARGGSRNPAASRYFWIGELVAGTAIGLPVAHWKLGACGG